MFYLDAWVVERAAGELLEGDVRSPGFSTGVIHDSRLAKSITSLHQDLEDGRTTLLERQSRLAFILSHWILNHSDTTRSARTGSEPAGVKKAKEYLRERASEPVSLAELSQAAGLSAFRLNRVFSRIVGLAPHAYQVLLRVEKARKLLATGIRPAAAAAEAGFADQSHLNRHFRRITGVTPGEYGKIVQDR
jgi:AraC-like DNA-binding protein